MEAPLTSNPLYTRLTHNSRVPSPAVCTWLAIGLGLATLIVTLLAQDMPFFIIKVILIVTAAALSLLAPLLSGITAATITAYDVQREQFQLLRLTNLSREAIAEGYTGVVLHRLRLPLALLIGMMPALLVGLPLGLIWTVVAIALVGIARFAVTLGVRLGLAWRQAIPAAIVTVLVTQLVVCLPAVALYLMYLAGQFASGNLIVCIVLLVPGVYFLLWALFKLAGLLTMLDEASGDDDVDNPDL